MKSRKYIDLTGQRNHSLTVMGQAGRDTRLNRIMWQCKCDCGNEIKVCTGDWKAGRAKSCGCYRLRKGADHPNWRHGLTKTNDYQYRIRLRGKYGIDSAEYDRMLEEQNGKCAICGAGKDENRGHFLAVDHCHKTGSVRGLLCHTCNRGIGMLQDDAAVVARAAEYLKKGIQDVSTE